MIKLFVQLAVGTIFHFGDKPESIRIKLDSSKYISPAGVKECHPYVAVFEDKPLIQEGEKHVYRPLSR